MHIGIDCRFASVYAGLGTYTRELVTALLPLLSQHDVTLFTRGPTVWLPSSHRNRVRVIDSPYAPYSLAEQLEFPNIVQKSGIELFYATHFNVPLFLSVPFVCTVHDLILHRYPGSVSLLKRLAYRFVLRSSIKRAKFILTVSECTKSDLLRHYGQRVAAKTHVVYPGVSPTFSPQSENEQQRVRKQYSLSHPFLLYVGGCKEHKNVQTLIDAFTDAGLGEVELVLVASGRECAGLQKRERIRFLTDVPTEHLPALYSAAAGSVTATLDEGFYLPGVEAMASGCPVLATNVGAIPEVLGESALLVEPSRTALADGMRQLISDTHSRSSDHAQKLRLHASLYSWDAAAVATRPLLV